MVDYLAIRKTKDKTLPGAIIVKDGCYVIDLNDGSIIYGFKEFTMENISKNYLFRQILGNVAYDLSCLRDNALKWIEELDMKF